MDVLIFGILRYFLSKKSTNSYYSFPLFQANEAFKFVMQRKSTGKVVINTR